MISQYSKLKTRFISVRSFLSKVKKNREVNVGRISEAVQIQKSLASPSSNEALSFIKMKKQPE